MFLVVVVLLLLLAVLLLLSMLRECSWPRPAPLTAFGTAIAEVKVQPRASYQIFSL